MQSSDVSKPHPNLWTKSAVRKYLGFASEGDGFEEFAEQFLEAYYPKSEEYSELPEDEYFFAEQFAWGSVVPGIKALYHQWPYYDWKEFADWMTGSAPETSSSRRDFLVMGGDFTRVWREVCAVRREGLGR